MKSISQPITLAGLRAKTDQQLTAIINAELDRIDVLLRRHANRALAEATQAQAKAAKLLPLVYGFSESERRHLDSRLAELRAALDTARHEDVRLVE